MKAFLWIAIPGALLAGVLAYSAQTANPAAPNLIVHEWGTFTSCQDENGNAFGSINTDDEPLPPFVHDLLPGLINTSGPLLQDTKGGIPDCDPDVTMRLETPVLYFYPQGNSAPKSVDVAVQFRGGWLSQFYPDASVTAPGLWVNQTRNQIGHITGATVGSLEWRNVELNTSPGGPQTDDYVWTSPRQVNAAYVQTSAGETERFLFYRGVGHIDSPLRVIQTSSQLQIEAQPTQNGVPAITELSELWLADFRNDNFKDDGSCAFRVITGVHLTSGNLPASIMMPATFVDSDYSPANMALLRQSMHQGLVAAGLYDDEADALLNTWRLSYFKSGGERVFFIVPRAWTDQVLPLEIQPTAAITRVMVGRIELVTPDQRALLNKMAGMPAHTASDLYQLVEDYNQLGRFAAALVIHQEHIHPSPALEILLQHIQVGNGQTN
ncbi:MAG TPA: hypothetical protein VKJ65_07910 [Phycisphaerae bacterium]|nr:hypothetical protein [Phycisphaerae bacterium]